ncbi:MAG: hypothetical protein R3E50_16650 [Halioglobus sp.]
MGHPSAGSGNCGKRLVCAPRPSGTEAVYKIYAESFVSEAHLQQVLHEAQQFAETTMR